MRILFVFSAAEWSTADVARGYRKALVRRGHDVRDYVLYARCKYHARALGEKYANNMPLLSRQATENVVVEAMYHNADLVIITSGLSFHPNGLWLLRQAAFPAAIIFTESPYEDEKQLDFASVYPEANYFTQEKISVRRHGWGYLPAAFDPEVHKPTRPDPVDACDVLIVGTGWPERIRLLEGVNWSGIKLKIKGLWPELNEESPLWKYYQAGCVDNEFLPAMYAGAKICLNYHRAHRQAESMNPRAVEIAACGGFQLSDPREELQERFGDAVPTFSSSAELERMIRYYLANETERRAKAQLACARVENETFEVRANALMEAIGPRLRVPAVAGG